MIKLLRVTSIAPVRVITLASVVFATSVSAHDGDSLYRYFKLLNITPFEKHCVSTAQPGSELQRCLESQPKTEYYKIERNRSQARLNTLDEIAYDINLGDEDKKTPWETFCANLHSEADLCLLYCYEGIPCPYE